MTLLSSAVVPTGASGWVMFGMVSRTACRSSSTCLTCFSRPPTCSRSALPSAISSCFLAASFSLGMSLDSSFCRCWICCCLLEQAFALVVQLHDAVDVGRDVAVAAVGFDGLEIVADESGIQHGTFHGSGVRNPHKPQAPSRGADQSTVRPPALAVCGLAWTSRSFLQRHVGHVVLADVDLFGPVDAVVL